MALEATHIRFALDMKVRYGVTDINAFVSGSIYPDSRYVTGVDREATHPKGYRDDEMFTTSDFNKGWHAHLLCDEVQQIVMQERLPQTSEGDGQESWLKRSAIKILQDIDDAGKFDLTAYLPALAHVEIPNGESVEKMRAYHKIFLVMYRDPANVTIEDAYEMWLKFGIGEELAGAMRSIAEGYAQTEVIQSEVRALYERMLSHAKALL